MLSPNPGLGVSQMLRIGTDSETVNGLHDHATGNNCRKVRLGGPARGFEAAARVRRSPGGDGVNGGREQTQAGVTLSCSGAGCRSMRNDTGTPPQAFHRPTTGLSMVVR